ncbi:hypothetical protein [Noviherbaspirillum cavernae]|uniref:hypothetical protein n=1 Tax=Noviherbaspirillum cavernae TaxID=2320862 RepID=UPI0011C403F7|nr:hypothetical protein [Noviherbaspirillum cavernae]
MRIIDPSWVCPQIEQVDTDPDTGFTLDRYMIDDPDAVPRTIEVPNPECKIPSDAREVEDENYRALMAAQGVQPDGQPSATIQPSESGHPVAVFPPPETVEQTRARALVGIRRNRAPLLDALNGIASRAARAGDAATAEASDAAAQKLLNITVLPAFLAATVYDEMYAAIMDEYRAIADDAPASVKSAFIEVLA